MKIIDNEFIQKHKDSMRETEKNSSFVGIERVRTSDFDEGVANIETKNGTRHLTKKEFIDSNLEIYKVSNLERVKSEDRFDYEYLPKKIKQEKTGDLVDDTVVIEGKNKIKELGYDFLSKSRDGLNKLYTKEKQMNYRSLELEEDMKIESNGSTGKKGDMLILDENNVADIVNKKEFHENYTYKNMTLQDKISRAKEIKSFKEESKKIENNENLSL